MKYKPSVKDLMPGLFNEDSVILVPDQHLVLPRQSLLSDDQLAQSELDLVTMIEQVVKGGRVPPDLRIDDRDLHEFPNFYEWCFSKDGGNQAPFARQLFVATHLFGEWCPRCTKGFRNIHKVPVDYPAKDFPDKVTFLEHGVCPKCGARKSELFRTGELNVYSELIGVAGQRSGKSALIGLMQPYLLHKWLKMNKPVETLGLMKNSILVGTYVGLTFAKAMELLWTPITNAINDSPWYQQLFGILDFYGEKHGQELYNYKDTFLNFKHKNIFLSPSGPNKRTLRGACLTGDTLISTNKGFLHFNELISLEGQHKVSNLRIDSPKGDRKVSHTYMTQRETLKVTTRNGYEVKGTHEHPLLIVTPDLHFVWKPLDEIKVGDFIVSKTEKSNPLYNSKGVITKPHARIMGFLTANGYYKEFSSDDEFVIDRFLLDAFSLTGVKQNYVPGNTDRAGGVSLKVGNTGSRGNFHSIYLQPYGYNATNSYEKCIPLSVRQSSKEVIHEYLHAYFSCDCYIDGYELNPEIVISSASEKLIRQIHVLLLQYYGIVGRYGVRTFVPVSQRGKEDAYETQSHMISLTGYDAHIFAQYFPYAKAVRNYGDRIKNIRPLKGMGSDRRKVPYIKGFLWDTWEESRMQDSSGKILRRLVTIEGEPLLNSVKPLCFNRQNQTPHTIEHLIYEAEDWTQLFGVLRQINPSAARRLKRFLRLKPHFEEVVSIEENGFEPVYDVTVPKGHAFYANGLVSHNTRLTSCIDEIGWFPHGEENEHLEKAGANEVYVALDRSLKTVRKSVQRLLEQGQDNIPMAIAMNTSSPSSYMDKAMTLLRTHEGSSDVFTYHLSSWDMNPLYTKDDFAKEYREDPIKAERDFGANPPMSQNPWISDVEHIKKLMTLKAGRIRYRYTSSQNKSGQDLRSAKLLGLDIPSTLPPVVLSMDAGYSNNSFAIALTQPMPGGGARCIAVMEIAPRKGQNVLSYTKVAREVLYNLITEFNVALVLADRWQSIKILQDIEEDLGVYTQQYSLTPSDFALIHDYLTDEHDLKIQLPKAELKFEEVALMDLSDYPHCFKYKPASHLYHQFMTCEEDHKGNATKGAGYTDDLLRAVCLGLSFCLDEDMIHEYSLLGGSVQQQSVFIGTKGSGSGITSSAIGAKSSSSTTLSGIGAKG